jgi:hypothetical protein
MCFANRQEIIHYFSIHYRKIIARPEKY